MSIVTKWDLSRTFGARTFRIRLRSRRGIRAQTRVVAAFMQAKPAYFFNGFAKDTRGRVNDLRILRRFLRRKKGLAAVARHLGANPRIVFDVSEKIALLFNLILFL